MTDNLLSRLDKCPPFLVYYGMRLIYPSRITEIAQRSGLGTTTVSRLSERTTWAGVKVGIMARFCMACGVDPLNADSLKAAVKREMDKPEAERFLQLPYQLRGVMIKRFHALVNRAQLARNEPYVPRRKTEEVAVTDSAAA